MSEGGPPDGRRAFLLAAGVTGAALWLSRRRPAVEEPPAPAFRRSYAVAAVPERPEVAVVRGGSAVAAVGRAIAELGGMGRFVSRGDIVVLKPNMAWDRTPEQAANTSPDVLRQVARLAFDAGARRVVVAEVPIHDPRRTAERSGLAAAARAAGAELPFPDRFSEVDLGGEVLRVWPVFRPLLEADKVINLPAAKQHSLTGATLGIKNWYGILGGERRRLHQRIQESLADLARFMRPTLTVLDGWRVLARNGPSGGNLEDVELRQTIVAGTDPVALDAWAALNFFGLEAARLPYLAMAEQSGLGRVASERVRVVSL